VEKLMKTKLLVLPVVLIAILLAVASEALAVSEAAVLYLRIAPGARAAGMGEAFVAIADDATATHWNPAGLGAYPLADGWRQASVPAHLRPVRGIAPLKASGGVDYKAFDVWAVTAKGLARYDNRSWHLGEKFRTKSSQTVTQIVASYFNLTDEQRIAEMAAHVAETNNLKSRDFLTALADSILTIIPEEHQSRSAISEQFDSLIAAYNQCRVDWGYVEEIEKQRDKALQDGTVTEIESDRISFAVEKARRRTIYEELTIPYGVALGGEITAITSTGDNLVVGTDRGALVFNGKSWTTITAETGLPGESVTALETVGRSVLVGTDNGLALIAGTSLATLPGSAEMPTGMVDAVGARSMQDIWAVIDDQLHHFNGTDWQTGMPYTVTVDDTIDRVASRFSIYGTDHEMAIIRELLRASQPPAPDPQAEDAAADLDTTASDTPVTDSLAAESIMADSEPPAQPAPSETELTVEPGQKIVVPYSAGIKGRVHTIYPQDNNVLLIGTEFGMLRFTPNGWTLLGYVDYTVADDESFEDIVNKRNLTDAQAADRYRQALVAVNGLASEDITAGQTIKVYAAPLAAETWQIQRRSDKILAATAEGVLSYDGSVWQRADETGLGRSATNDLAINGDELWLTTEDKLVTKANGRREISFMHVNWLPDLADDLYYEFLAFVANKEGWGTFGGSITFISYGTFERRGEGNEDLGTFESFDLAVTGSYGTRLSNRMAGGVSVKFLYSRLADQGTAAEKGSGNSVGFAVDLGLLYEWTPRLTLGLAITNLGPDMSYIDAAQSDPLPRNIALGFAYKLMETDYYHLLLTLEANKLIADLSQSVGNELESVVLNGGGEFQYADLIAFRAGYIYDQAGDVKTLTLGAGLAYSIFRFDFSYIPSSESTALANTLRVSLAVTP
jgi:hypothetical protein